MPVHRRGRLALFALLAGSFALFLAACGSSAATSGRLSLAPESALPDSVRAAAPPVKEAYRFAAANPDVLKQYPCYCGCGAMGHTSNLSCYITGTAPDGSITFDNHALGCGVCVDITQDVMRLTSEGKSTKDIRAYIDTTYSQYGPPTNTPPVQ
jgi:hypothetical protein